MLSILRLDEEALEKAVQEQIQAENESLPLQYTFMLYAEDAQTLEDALKLFPDEGRSRQLIALCQKQLELSHAEQKE